MKSELVAKWLGPRPRERLLLAGSMLLVLCIFAILLPYFYVGAEHYFYSWDWANYQNMASAATAAFRASSPWAVNAVMTSLSKDYNWLFAVPLLPILVPLGDSRVVFIVSLALVYFLPFALVLGAIATKLIPIHPRGVFWSTALLTLLIPTIWAPTLRGWPDVGAAFLIALAIWAHLEDRLLTRKTRILLIGILVVGAMLFRRQYAYDSVALYAALGLQAVVLFAQQFRQDRRKALRQFLEDAQYIGFAGVVSILTLVLVGWPFLFHVLAHDYISLYSSYEQPVGVVLHGYLSEYGWGIWALALVGFIAGLRKGSFSLVPAVLLLFYGCISFLEWVVVVRQGGPHYSLHFAWLIVLGISSLGWAIWEGASRKAHAMALTVIVLFLLLNFVAGLAPEGRITHGRLQPVFAKNYPPLVRRDYEAVAALISYLRNMTKGEPTYVVAASLILNPDLVKNAEGILYGQGNEVLRVITSPEVDSRDFYPLEPLLKADYVLLARPFQHELPAHQEVVESVYDAFTENWAISRDFVRLPAQFPLENNVTVNIYRRIRTTSPETALQTLLKIQRLVGQIPGGQAAWLVLGQLPQSTLRSNGNDAASIETLVFGSGESDTTSFAYLEAPPEKAKVTGTITFLDDRCSGATLQIATTNREGQITKVADIVRHPGDTGGFTSALFRTEGATDLLLSISRADQTDPNGSCALRIDDLRVLGK